MKKIIVLLAALGLTGITRAQSFEDAVRFSRLTNFGTARSAAMGGAFGALGGDLSAISSNPAGIGVFRKSEVGFTPYLNLARTTSNGQTVNDNSFQLGDLGAVMSFYSPSFDWKGINIGINYTNMNNFNRKTNQSIANSPTTWTAALAAASGTTSPQSLYTYTDGLAYDTKLTYQVLDGQYFSVLELQNESGENYFETVNQYKTIKEDGYQGEYTFSFGTNYKDKLYLGMNIGIQSLSYRTHSTYQEVAPEQSPTGLDFYQFDEHQKTNGVGTNLKFGIIYRPIPVLRIGAAIHTPTWYNMSQRMETTMYSLFNSPQDPSIGREDQEYYAGSGVYSFDYNMRTPWRAVLSLATVLGQKAIISADYEYINYTNANFAEASDNFSYAATNQTIQDYLHSTHNFRVGAEYRVNSIFSLRAGYAFWDSPYYDITKSNNRVQSLSGGFGLNFGTFYCDAAYVYKQSKNETLFYSYDDKPDYTSLTSYNKYKDHEARITFGVRF